MLLLPLALAAEPAPTPWVVAGGDVVVHVGDAAPHAEITYRLRRIDRGWAELRLVGPGVVARAAPVVEHGSVLAGPGGTYVVLPPDATTATVRLDVALPDTVGAASLSLLAGPGITVAVDAPGLDVTSSAVAGTLPSSGELSLSWRPHVDTPPAPPEAVVAGEAAVGAWATDAGLAVRARARWKVLRGEQGVFVVDVGPLQEVEISGPNVASADVSGGRARVVPRAPVTGLFEVEVTGRMPLSAGAPVEIPRVGPVVGGEGGVRRVERLWTLGRAEEGEIIPEGGRAISPRAVPVWARGLTDTPPLASWRGETFAVRATKYEPLMGPDTVVEDAEFILATSAEGRELLRSTWLVRNERRQYLHVRPAPGFRPMTARVSGAPVAVLSDGAGGLYVPLEKSVETMQGLVSFPVEVTWIADLSPWDDRRGERAFQLPAVDAPIQSARWAVHLPREYRAEGEERARRRGGILTVGSGAGGGALGGSLAGDTTIADPAQQAQADRAQSAWLNALDSYKQNNFEDAREWLDVARQYDADDKNVARLQSNLDVLLPSSTAAPEGAPAAALDTPEVDEPAPAAEDAQARRIRELANAKTVDAQVKQAEAERNAEEALRKGDVAKAEGYLQEVVVLADRIGVTEQRESLEQAEKKKEAKDRLDKATASKAAPRSETGSFGEKDTGREDGLLGGQVLGGVSGEDSDALYRVDGVAVADEESDDVGGEIPVEAPAVVVDTESVSQSTPVTVTEEYVVRVPVARTYQSVVAAAPGVAGRGGKSGKSAAGPAPTTRTTTATTTAPSPSSPPPAPAPPPPAEPAKRAALTVRASPLTPALPLDGPVVTHDEALLPADTFPTFTLSYRGPR